MSSRKILQSPIAHAVAVSELPDQQLGTSAKELGAEVGAAPPPDLDNDGDQVVRPYSVIAHAAAVGDGWSGEASSTSLPPPAGEDPGPEAGDDRVIRPFCVIAHASAVGDGWDGAASSTSLPPPAGEDDIQGFSTHTAHAAGVGDLGYEGESSKAFGEGLLEAEREAAEVRTRSLLEEMGMKPVVDFVPCFPPEGIYYNLGMLALGYASHLGQTVTFVMQRDWTTAGLMALVLAVAWYYSWLLLFHRPGLVLGIQQVSYRIQRSVRSGVEDPELQTLVALGSSVASAFGTLLAPYRLLWASGLSWPSAANAAVGLLLHTKSLADELQGDHFGELQRQYGRAVVKSRPEGDKKCLALQLWALCAMGAQVALTAVFARAWHPLAAILLFAPVAAAYAEAMFGAFAGSRKPFSRPRLFLHCYLEPGNLLAPMQSSVFGLHQWDAVLRANLGNIPALHHCAAQAFRLAAVACLLCLDFPEAPVRPMGSGVLWGQLVEPALGLFQGRISPDAAFKAFILIFLLGTLPVYLCGSIALLVSNAHFRDGEQDQEACARMDQMKEEVEACLRGEIA